MSKHALAALSSALFTLAWWRASALRGLRTAVVIAVPYLGTAVVFTDVSWLTVASAAALGFIASLLTSLAGIPEASGTKIPVWLALVERTTKTLAQGIAVGIGNAVLFTDVHWSSIIQAALLSALGTLLIAVLGFLPEADDPTAAAVMIAEPQIVNAHAVTVVGTVSTASQPRPLPAPPAPPAPAD